MLSKRIEYVRQNLEEIENLERAVSHVLQHREENPKTSTIDDHKLVNLCQQIEDRSRGILDCYKNFGGEIQQEVETASGDTADLESVTSSFYAEIGQLMKQKDTLPVFNLENEYLDEQYFLKRVFDPPNSPLEFSADEHNGRYLDLYPFYMQLLNDKTLRNIAFKDYLHFLRDFDRLYDSDVDFKIKNSSQYLKFFEGLGNFLKGFYKRSQPLSSHVKVEEQIARDFEEKYSEHLRNLAGGQNGQADSEAALFPDANGHLQPAPVANNNPGVDSHDEGVFNCQACQKDFFNRNTYLNHFNGKQHKKNAVKIHQGNGSTLEPTSQPDTAKEKLESIKKRISKAEHTVQQYFDLLADSYQNTLNSVRRRQTYNAEEYSEANSFNSEDDLQLSDQEEEPKKNLQKKLPIGWDGKPIPMWLFKQQGLGVEFKCEICGNYSYWGRRAFEKHFTEWRHSYGMKCLRIPNTPHFREITSINDALILHKKLLMEANTHQFNPDFEEEVEDENGNVVKGKTGQISVK
jgi:splicing factor 3A subunit 3